MKIPYGVSNFDDIRRDGYFYVDKTPFLPVLEQLGGRYLIFLRPRRMGKSLFVSLLAHYYDIHLADRFDALFEGLWIHRNPTPERHRYVVLQLDFSRVGVDGGPDVLRRTFFETVRTAALDVISKYRGLIPELERIDRELDRYQDADALVAELLASVRRGGHRAYVLIDEYDNFANRLLSGGQREPYEVISTKTGFVRSFYAALKAATASGAVSRIFMTGVTPLLIDDVSSGFNIATHVSLDQRLNALAGFTEAEVEQTLDAFLAARPHIAPQPEISDRERLLQVLESNYDGYRFCFDAEERVFNSDMVLYFLKELDAQSAFPTELLDPNVRTDYEKLERIGSLASAGAETRRQILETILAEGGVTSEVVRQFGVKRISTGEAFVSLLYYMGMLTLAAQPPSPLWRLEIPNRVIRDELFSALSQEAAMNSTGPKTPASRSTGSPRLAANPPPAAPAAAPSNPAASAHARHPGAGRSPRSAAARPMGASRPRSARRSGSAAGRPRS